MFEVRGIPIFVDEVEILQELRRQVYEQQGKDILRKIKRSGNNIMICCPHHNDGQERRPSCGITTVRIKDKAPGTVHCFSCGYVNSLEGMISECFGHEGEVYGSNWLINNFVSGELFERPDIPMDDLTRENNLKPKPKYITEEELASYRYYHPYMFQRKLTEEVIEKYDVGYQKDFIFESQNDTQDKKAWKPMEVLTFPVKDKNGNCLFVSRRAIYNKTFFLPPNIEKPVYGIYELPKNCKEVIICESVINALTCVGYGRPAIALFGTGDEHQYEELNKLPVRQFILALDPDFAGDKGTKKLKKALKGKILTKLVLPKGKDINDLNYEEFLSLPEIFL